MARALGAPTRYASPRLEPAQAMHSAVAGREAAPNIREEREPEADERLGRCGAPQRSDDPAHRLGVAHLASRLDARHGARPCRPARRGVARARLLPAGPRPRGCPAAALGLRTHAPGGPGRHDPGRRAARPLGSRSRGGGATRAGAHRLACLPARLARGSTSRVPQAQAGCWSSQSLPQLPFSLSSPGNGSTWFRPGTRRPP